MKQYEIVVVNLDPTIGSEIKKTRPCIIISPDELNSVLKTLIIAPITSTSKGYPTRVKVNKADIKGNIALDQLRTINKRRIIKQFGQVSTKTIIQIKKTIKEMLVD